LKSLKFVAISARQRRNCVQALRSFNPIAKDGTCFPDAAQRAAIRCCSGIAPDSAFGTIPGLQRVTFVPRRARDTAHRGPCRGHAASLHQPHGFQPRFFPK
jgi:hypothetical protein